MPVKNKNGLTLSLEELEVKSDNSWESNNDEKAAKKMVNKHLVRLLNFIPGNLLDFFRGVDSNMNPRGLAVV